MDADAAAEYGWHTGCRVGVGAEAESTASGAPSLSLSASRGLDGVAPFTSAPSLIESPSVSTTNGLVPDSARFHRLNRHHRCRDYWDRLLTPPLYSCNAVSPSMSLSLAASEARLSFRWFASSTNVGSHRRPHQPERLYLLRVGRSRIGSRNRRYW